MTDFKVGDRVSFRINIPEDRVEIGDKGTIDGVYPAIVFPLVVVMDRNCWVTSVRYDEVEVIQDQTEATPKVKPKKDKSR